jgi:MoxR-like ATPase
MTPASLRDAVLPVIRRQIVGHEEVQERLLVALLCGGHVLLEGVPGLAKTLIARTLASALDVSFRRIQFTPDLLPSDVVGGLVYRRSTETFAVSRGPIFAGVVLADELNRAPPRVQAALLEAMEEGQVTLGGHTLPLPRPFLVLATQNPLDQQGTYPLAEAQLDRFLFHLVLDYPGAGEEAELLDRTLDGPAEEAGSPLSPVASGEVLRAQAELEAIHVDAAVRDYITRLVRATRPGSRDGDFPGEGVVEAGVSPRAGLALARAARAHAGLRGRDHVLPADVQALAPDTFRHRILLSPEAELDGWTPDRVVDGLLDAVPVP